MATTWSCVRCSGLCDRVGSWTGESTFLRCGWDVEWLGPEIALPVTNEVVRAALMPVNDRTNQKLRDTTGLHDPILSFGTGSAEDVPGDTLYSHIAVPDERLKQAA